MKQRSAKRLGLTLIEMVIGLIIISIIFVAVFNIFSIGLRGSNKGMAHLTIMEGAAILLAQIEYDLLRATKLKDPAAGASDKDARWEILLENTDNAGIIMYSLLEDGIERTADVDGKQHKYVYCRGLKVSLNFQHVTLSDPANAQQKAGMWVELNVEAPAKFATEEKFSMKRLIICKNILDPL